jgi:histone H3/H4
MVGRISRSKRSSPRSFKSIGAALLGPSDAMNIKKMKNISKSSFRRVVRRAGVKRVSGAMHNELLKSTHTYMSKALHDAVAVMGGRKTLKTTDILFALKSNGRVLYT